MADITADASTGVVTAGTGAARNDKIGLDELMLAMDVVDTLRHEEKLVERELNEEAREHQLVERLRAVYAKQGIEVPDHVIADGVAALKEDRFTYTPPASGLRRTLAHAYVTRHQWGRKVAIVALAGVVAVAALFAVGRYNSYQETQARIAVTQQMPKQIEALSAQISAIARDEEALTRAAALANAGIAAARNENSTAAQEQITKLTALLAQLKQEYTIRIVSRSGEKSGLERTHTSGGKAHYLIVEALDADGKALSVPIRNDESSAAEHVKKWGIRVEKRVFDAVRTDKLADGIVNNAVVGHKRLGRLAPEYSRGVGGGSITAW